MDAAVVGDAEPVPFVERDPFLRLGEGTRAERLQVGMDILADLHERSAGVWRARGDAAAGDDELEAWMREGEQRRRLDTVRSLERIFERPITGPMVDAIWMLYGPESYWKLVHVIGHVAHRVPGDACRGDAAAAGRGRRTEARGLSRTAGASSRRPTC